MSNKTKLVSVDKVLEILKKKRCTRGVWTPGEPCVKKECEMFDSFTNGCAYIMKRDVVLIQEINQLEDEQGFNVESIHKHCDSMYGKNLPDTCYQCAFGHIYDDGYCVCMFENEPFEWDLEQINEAQKKLDEVKS